ncbi:hypothetical protein HGA88_05005 [Candidatus Roizmanbacteria bacterium]|nr:hypothetical protein [Candidatus Roizmanbacteria bacterium]
MPFKETESNNWKRGWNSPMPNGVEPSDQTVTSEQLIKAGTVISSKILWLVPTWDCALKCKHCFAAPSMQDAKAQGHLSFGTDFLEKTGAGIENVTFLGRFVLIREM